MSSNPEHSAEHDRLASDHEAWTAWGPYLAERAWGTVREDYSPSGKAWDSFPYPHASKRAYRWNEDGLAGFCDRDQRWCLAFAFWNGRDDHLKERLFGLSGPQGNHGEDVKEEWWYLDATPTHSFGKMAYAYPQQAFPYEQLIQENGNRSFDDVEYELVDTGVFDQGWWDIEVTHAKANPDDLCVRVRITNRGDHTDTIHTIPTLWFRNRWSWGNNERELPTLSLGADGSIVVDEADTGRLHLSTSQGGQPLFCNNETNAEELFGTPNGSAYTKDGIDRHVTTGEDTVNPENKGTKAGVWFSREVAPGETIEIRVRLAHEPEPVAETFDELFALREAEAAEFYDVLLDGIEGEEHLRVARQAFAGLLFTKQWYHFEVDRWLDGDPAFSSPDSSRHVGRNAGWRHVNAADVLSMPDTWEYPWFAAWDTAFHCLPLAMLDPAFAKEQLRLLCREWYQHPNGQLPAYEWSFDDVNPPVHAWAALRVFELDGASDTDFLERMLHKLILNFTWWVNRVDPDGNNLFEGGFLGLDNIGPFNRSGGPAAGALEQADATAWMAMYSLDLLDMALRLSATRSSYEDLAVKFVEHFAYISAAMNDDQMWNDDDGFYYDLLRLPRGNEQVKVRSMVGLIPIFATRVVPRAVLDELPDFATRLFWFRENKSDCAAHMHENERGDILLSMVSPDRLVRLLSTVLDEEEFLSDHGVRALSKAHEAEPYSLKIGGREFSVGYEPGESKSGLFGGNSNWRGPVWFPVNHLLIESLRRFDWWSGGTLTAEFPVGSGQQQPLNAIADELSTRLASLFLPDEEGVRPSHAANDMYRSDGPWNDRVLFHEYFHGDSGKGLGASHQTGWTSLVSMLMMPSSRPFGRRRFPRGH